MRIIFIIFLNGLIWLKESAAQVVPTFGPEILVNINGLNFDAMEPFLSEDENILFFNSLNAGGNTNLHYATRVNDSTFNYASILNGTVDTSINHLDAVASMDTSNRFYWVSLRNYPAVFENLHSGFFNGSTISDIKRVYGNFNIPTLGWIIMDASIAKDGNELYYCNAYFDFINNSCGAGIPCSASLGVAQQINDSTFNKLSNTEALFAQVNDTNYLVYAPQLSNDGLELYFTRLLKNTFNTQVCVAVRNSNIDNFGAPQVIHQNNGFAPEGPTLSADKQKLYYHQKDLNGLHKIYLRYRNNSVGYNYFKRVEKLSVFPIPTKNELYFKIEAEDWQTCLYTSEGQLICYGKNQNSFDITHLKPGIYFLRVTTNAKVYFEKVIKLE